jgi:hypothetical protein
MLDFHMERVSKPLQGHQLGCQDFLDAESLWVGWLTSGKQTKA